MSEYRNRRGNPISGLEWQRRFDDANYRAVSNDLLDNGMQVSTFWVGVADGAPSDARPLFETLVFGGENDHRKRTYATLAQAIHGHRTIVDKLRGLGAVNELSADTPASHDRPSMPHRIARHTAVRPWIRALVPQLAERLRSDSRLEIIAGTSLPIDSADAARVALDPPTASIDLLIRENSARSPIPRVAIQCVSGGGTREVRVCDAQAARLRASYPGMRNGLMIRNADHIPPAMILHGTRFDFLVALNAQSLVAGGHCDFVNVLLDEVQSSRVLGMMLNPRPERKRCTLIHRPMFLPGNQ